MKKFKKILLVDDDQISSWTSKFILEELGLADEVVQAPNGQQAIDLLTQADEEGRPAPDMILLDLEMPVMDGLEFIEHLPKKDSFSQLLNRIVMLSSSMNPYHERTAKAMGVKWYLHRPLCEKNIRPVLKGFA